MVSPTEVAGVPLGIAADEAERRLRQTLGVPVRQRLQDCDGQSSGQALTWKALRVFLTDGGDGGPVVLSGWLVDAGANAKTIGLPYDTAVGDSARDVLARAPASTGETSTEGPYAGTFVVTTDEAPGLLWLAASEDGFVDEASFAAPWCD